MSQANVCFQSLTTTIIKKYTYTVERFGDTCRNLCYVYLNFLFHIVLVFCVLYYTSTFEAKPKRTKKGVPLDLLVCSISGGGFIIVSDNFTPILINLDCLNYGDKRCQLQIKEAPMTKLGKMRKFSKLTLVIITAVSLLCFLFYKIQYDKLYNVLQMLEFFGTAQQQTVASPNQQV